MTLPRGWPDILSSAPDMWSWIADTYWYVQPPDLSAFVQVDGARTHAFPVADQTVWYIGDYADHHFSGTSFTDAGGGWNETSLSGSIAPDGGVSIAFPTASDGPDDSSRLDGDGVPQTVQRLPEPIVGTGTIIAIDGEWQFQMNVDGRQDPVGLFHSADMIRTAQRDDARNAFPGHDDTSIDDLFGGASTADGHGSGMLAAAAPVAPAATWNMVFERAGNTSSLATLEFGRPIDDPTFVPPPPVDYGRPINDPTFVLPPPPPTTRDAFAADFGAEFGRDGGFDFLL